MYFFPSEECRKWLFWETWQRSKNIPLCSPKFFPRFKCTHCFLPPWFLSLLFGLNLPTWPLSIISWCPQLPHKMFLLVRKILESTVFWPYSATQEWALGLKYFLTKRQRVLTACDDFITVCGNIFFCFRLNACSFVLPERVSCGTWPTPLLYLSPVRRGWDPLFLQHWRDLLALGDSHPLRKVILHLFSLWVRCCSIQCRTELFSLMTLIPRCSEWKCWDFYFWWLALAGHFCLALTKSSKGISFPETLSNGCIFFNCLLIQGWVWVLTFSGEILLFIVLLHFFFCLFFQSSCLLAAFPSMFLVAVLQLIIVHVMIFHTWLTTFFSTLTSLW